jgi:hypothetical protein
MRRLQGDIVYAKEPEHVFYNDVNPELVPGLVKELSGFSYKCVRFNTNSARPGFY